MTDVLTVTMNPCVDVSTSTAVVAPTHKLRCAAPVREPGGGGINVARVLHRLGTFCTALYPAGGMSGETLARLLEAEGVPGMRIPISGETRESFHVRDLSAQQEYRFVMPGPMLLEAEWQACLQLVAASERRAGYWVASGSLPPGVPDDFYAQLARRAREHNIRFVLDASGPALATALMQGVYLVKPSLRELRDLSGQALLTAHEWRDAAQQLVRTGQAQVVVLSLGAQGALLVSRDAVLSAPALPVSVVSAVGAGDSFVGGMVASLAAGASLAESFRRGVAAASASLLSSGTGLCQPVEVDRLFHEVVVQEG